MDHISIDVHKTESQLCILGEDGQLSELRIHPRTVCRRPGEPAAPTPPNSMLQVHRWAQERCGWRGCEKGLDLIFLSLIGAGIQWRPGSYTAL
jgi:hypothetical protein